MGQTKIPDDIRVETHYAEIRSILRIVLREVEKIVDRQQPKWVSCRLNQSGESRPKPYFMGWLENRVLRKIRKDAHKPDPGPFRFLADTAADTYSNCLAKPGEILKQQWPVAHIRPKDPPILEELKLYLRDGYYQLPRQHETWRLSAAIKVDNIYVGTLNTGLTTDPGDRLNETLKYWAWNDESDLVQYVKDEFDFS
jgi:hypothetical protein